MSSDVTGCQDARTVLRIDMTDFPQISETQMVCWLPETLGRLLLLGDKSWPQAVFPRVPKFGSWNLVTLVFLGRGNNTDVRATDDKAGFM